MCTETTHAANLKTARKPSKFKSSTKSSRPIQAWARNSMRSSIFLNRFRVEAALVDDMVCGGYDGGFECEVEVFVDRLDADGFAVHNERFVQTVRDEFARGTFKASCEELSAGVAFVATQMVDDRLTSVHVRVYNLTGYTTAVWKRGMKIPTFPRFATDKEIERTHERREAQVPRSRC